MLVRLKKNILSATFKDTLISLSGNGITAFGGAFFTIILARALSPDNFGLFSALWALGILLASLGDLGISAALINFLPKVKDDKKAIISLTFWLQLASALLLGLITINFLFLRQTIIPGSTSGQYLLLGFLVAILIVEAFIQNIFTAERKFIITTFLQATDSLVKLTIVTVLFFKGGLKIETAIIAAIVSATLVMIVGLFREFKNISFVFPKIYFRKIIKFTKWIALTRVFSVAVSRIDVILLTSLSTNFQAGIFAAASRIALIFTLLASSLGNVTAPRFSSFVNHDDTKRYLKKLFAFALLLTFGMLITTIFARPIISIVFGDKYLAAIPVFQFLTIAMIPFLFTLVTVNPLIYYFNQPKFIAKITIIQVLLLITLDFILIPRYGALAPTISLGISNLFLFAITGIKVKQLLS